MSELLPGQSTNSPTTVARDQGADDGTEHDPHPADLPRIQVQGPGVGVAVAAAAVTAVALLSRPSSASGSGRLSVGTDSLLGEVELVLTVPSCPPRVPEVSQGHGAGPGWWLGQRGFSEAAGLLGAGGSAADEALSQVALDALERDALLGHRVALAHGDSPILGRVEVIGQAEGRTDLVLAAVATADGAGVVVLHVPGAAQAGGQLLGRPGQLLLAAQRQDGCLDRGDAPRRA